MNFQVASLQRCTHVSSPCMPAVVLYCCIFQDAVRLKMFFFSICFYVYTTCVKKYYKHITVQY